MKRVYFFSIIICGVILAGCREDKTTLPDPNAVVVEPVQPKNPPTPMKAGMLIFNDINVVKKVVSAEDAFLIASESSSISTKSKSGLKASYDEPEGEFHVEPYRFKLVEQMDALIVPLEGEDIKVQATHVQIDDKYAYVSYNLRGEPNIGGLVVYKYTVHHGTLEEATVDVNLVGSIKMPYSQINAIDIDDNRLYLAGATERPKDFFGNSGREDRAFLMILELDAERNFIEQEPAVKQLTSYQATSIRKYQDKVYVTVGDGTDGPPPTGNWNNLMNGGLFVYDANNYSFITYILGLVHARSVDVDDDFVYLYQANHARVSKFSHNSLNIGGKVPLYEDVEESWQRDAKSEIMAWKDYLFVAENESGLRMVNKNGGFHQAIKPPNFDGKWDKEEDVTNSMSMNSDPKKNAGGKDVQSDLLLVANGEQGISWYDVTKPIHDPDGKEWIASNGPNRILDQMGSANYVTSAGNVAFVADGKGGLKVLYIGFNYGDEEPPIAEGACKEFMGYVYDGEDNVSPLFPESKSVFRSDADPIVKRLFQQPSRTAAKEAVLKYIEIKKETELFITYMFEGAGWNNALGYFVIPADVAKDDQAEWNYWNNTVRRDMYTTSNNRNILKNDYIIFSRVKDQSKGGSMKAGNTYQIGGPGKSFKPGERVVLFMCPDGWSSQNNSVEVTFTNGTTKQIFFMHPYFNSSAGLNIRYSALYSSGNDSFAGAQMNSFYSADCRSMVLLVEDYHAQGSDVDFNDIIFSITDNLRNEEIRSFVPPVWAVGKDKDSGELLILPIEEVLK